MKSYQLILEECLTALANDTATVEECLARYPEYAEELKPLLKTVRVLKLGRSVKPSLAFKAYSRVYLTQHLRLNPHHSQRMRLSWQIVTTLAMLVATLFVTGTVHAQTVLPGDNFYPWKRASEEIWRALSINPVGADIILSERRLNEWVTVADDPKLSGEAMVDYFGELDRLKQGDNLETHKYIAPVIQTHHEILDQAGLPGAELVGSYVALQITPSPVATITQFFTTNTPNPTPTKPIPTGTATELPSTPTATDEPTFTPTVEPTFTLTIEPTFTPTDVPTDTPTNEPTATPIGPEPTATFIGPLATNPAPLGINP
jgi:hypothetical protein